MEGVYLIAAQKHTEERRKARSTCLGHSPSQLFPPTRLHLWILVRLPVYTTAEQRNQKGHSPVHKTPSLWGVCLHFIM